MTILIGLQTIGDQSGLPASERYENKTVFHCGTVGNLIQRFSLGGIMLTNDKVVCFGSLTPPPLTHPVLLKVDHYLVFRSEACT